MSSSVWYIMQTIQSKYSLSERLIRAIAVRSFPHDSVEDLINRGADVNCTHGTLKPLHCACMMSDPDCVELLLEKGAEVNATDGYHRAALHYAAEKDEACVEVLLEFGADPDAPDGNHDTPLHWAAFKDRAACARALLEGGASVEASDYHRDTPLSWAAARGNLGSARVLLEYGAQARVANLKGQTPAGRLRALLGRGLGGEREEACLRLLGRAAGAGWGEGAPWEPGSLKGLSRQAVRRSLGARHLPAAVEGLPLPGSVKRYLLLDG
uniref:ankyrin repeat and SOCS box protein 8 n=1 Tax=Pristiophorus japonicus TaxID=55135 RepID=UPI00398ED936